MKKAIVFLLVIITSVNFTALSQDNETKESGTKILISTDYGDITAVLYNETHRHRDNFIKLVQEGWYNGSPFHRVIKNFMIQGGQNADGRQDPGNKIPAEFNTKYFHKKGALAAARMGDNVNPKKESSGSQFYIVQGKIASNSELDSVEKRGGKKFTEEQREAYTNVGGTFFLDGAYTVFGQVIEGFDVIDKIADVKTDPRDKPLQDVKMTIKIIE